MVAIDHDTLVVILSEHEGVDLVSFGKPRDGFELQKNVPHWTSGFGGKYEMVHSNVPAGVMIAAGNLEDLKIDDFEGLKAQLKQVDIYPTGHSGDFTGKDLTVLRKWFFDRSVQNDEVNFQWPLIHTAHQLAPEKLDGYLGQGHYRELVEYLADEMNLFKDPKNDNRLEPQDRDARVEIVESLLHGMSQSIRYTRLDDPAKGYQIKSAVDIVKQNAGTISLKLEDVYKILVVRKDKDTGKESITPLDKEMLKRTYATKDGEPLGERGTVDLMDILARAEEIEKEKASNETGAANAIKTIVEEGPKPRGGREKK